MKQLIVIFILLVLPSAVLSAEKKHIKTSEDQECYECHGDVTQVWQDGKHGLMNVKCIVCHGATDKNFVSKPDIYRCRGCHGEKVKDVEDKLPVKIRNCFLCHEPHSVSNRFHSEGGK